MMILDGVDWYLVDVNPEPWTVGTVGTGRRDGRITGFISSDAQMVAFKEAVAESLVQGSYRMREGDLSVTFYFYRRQSDYKTAGGPRHRKHIADATNMQKAAEDALQGILFENDRNNLHVESYVMEQGPEAKGLFVVSVGSFVRPALPRAVELSVDITGNVHYTPQPFIEEGRPDVSEIF